MKKLRTLDFYIIPLVIAAISGVILRLNAILDSFNHVTMHFDHKTSITIASVIVLLAIAGFATYLIFGEKENDLIAKTDNAASYIPAGIVSTALLFMGIRNLELGLNGYTAGTLRTICLLTAILAFLSIGSLFISIFMEKKNNSYKAAFSLSIVFFLALYSAQLFFSKQIHPTNSPNKLVDQMAYISAALFFLYESRIPLGRAKWRPYISFGLIATLLTAYSAIPSLVVYAINGYVVSDSIIESVLTLTLCIFIFSKVLQTRNLTPNAECDAAKSITLMAMMREEEIEEMRKISHARDINNMEEKDDAEDTSNYTFDIPYVEGTTDFNPEDASIDLNQNYSE